MKNSIGTSIIFTLFGESHGEAIGFVLDGITPGVEIDNEYIKLQLSKRSAKKNLSTDRLETDEYEFLSGVFNNKTTGTPISCIIKNKNVNDADYDKTYGMARPAHADFTQHVKYRGFEDYRGGGHFSGRLTAPIVVAGSICELMLKQKNILIGTHIKSLQDIKDSEFTDYKNDLELLSNKSIEVLDDKVLEVMKNKVESVKKDCDSMGGIAETVVLNMPVGVGEPWFDNIESMISHAVFSIPAVKGITFGSGFDFNDMLGSVANDKMRYENGKVITTTNHNAGINGGISNGMPIIFDTVFKPTPSIFKEQESIDFIKKENVNFTIKGRHDPCIILRATVVVSCMTALVISDLLAQRYGTDFIYKDF